MNRRTGWTLGIVVPAALASGVIGYGSSAHRKPELQFEAMRVDRGRIVARVTATGTLSALVTVQVGSQVSGRIKEIFVDFSSPVKKGQVIARMDRRLFQASAEQALANLEAAEGNLARAQAQAVEAERQFRRTKLLADRELVSPADADTRQAEHLAARAAVAAARGGVEQARAARHQADVSLAYATIVSPIDGIVISRNVDIGQTVAASLQAPTLFTIAEDLRKMQVDTAVSEADVGKIAARAKATFTVDAYPGEKFHGVIRQIRDAPQAVQNVVTYDAVVDVDNSDLKLKPGMTANVTFVYAERDDVLRLPSAALRFRAPPALLESLAAAGGKPGRADDQETTTETTKETKGAARRAVWVLRAGAATPTPVATGISDGSHVEIVDGALAEGDAVVTDASGGAGAGKGKDGSLPGAKPKKGKRLF